MLSYGLHRSRIAAPGKDPLDIPGAVSLEETSSVPELYSVYNDGSLTTLGLLAPKQYSAKLTVYSEFDPPEDPSIFVYSYMKHGRRGIGALLNVRFVRLNDTHESMDNAPKPNKVGYEIHTTSKRVGDKITSRVLFEERLMGTENFDNVEKYLYGQNDIKIGFDDGLNLDDLSTRRFKVLYNRYGNWEVSGPDNLIRNSREGVWEIDDINHINVNTDEFILIDDYEEGETWLP